MIYLLGGNVDKCIAVYAELKLLDVTNVKVVTDKVETEYTLITEEFKKEIQDYDYRTQIAIVLDENEYIEEFYSGASIYRATMDVKEIAKAIRTEDIINDIDAHVTANTNKYR